jgi:transposase-like protein
MDDHLGYAKHDPAGRDGGNSRNGTRTKQLTDVGPLEVAILGTGAGRLSRRSCVSASDACPGSTDG